MTTKPEPTFSAPGDVLDSSLPRKEKVRALRRWEQEEHLRMVADDESMTGGPANRLQEVRECLRALGEEAG